MCDLESRIEQWRRSLAESVGRREVIDELESHLRDEFQRLVQTGQPPEQAFATAAARLGSPQALAAEFAKVPPAAPWLPVRWVTVAQIAVAALLLGLLLTRIRDGRMGLLLASHVFAVTLGYCGVFFVGALAVCYILVRPFGDLSRVQAESLRRAALRLTGVALALTALGVVLGGFWARENLGFYWEWDPREIGGLAVLGWGGLMLVMLGRRLVGDLGGMLLAVVGNVVVSLAWFGSVMVVRSYGFSTGFYLLVLFVLSQLALLALGFVPPGRLRGRRA